MDPARRRVLDTIEAAERALRPSVPPHLVPTDDVVRRAYWQCREHAAGHPPEVIRVAALVCMRGFVVDEDGMRVRLETMGLEVAR